MLCLSAWADNPLFSNETAFLQRYYQETALSLLKSKEKTVIMKQLGSP